MFLKLGAFVLWAVLITCLPRLELSVPKLPKNAPIRRGYWILVAGGPEIEMQSADCSTVGAAHFAPHLPLSTTPFVAPPLQFFAAVSLKQTRCVVHACVSPSDTNRQWPGSQRTSPKTTQKEMRTTRTIMLRYEMSPSLLLCRRGAARDESLSDV